MRPNGNVRGRPMRRLDVGAYAAGNSAVIDRTVEYRLVFLRTRSVEHF